LRALHLARDDGRDAWRQTLAFVTMAWAPLVILSVAQRLATPTWNVLVLDPAVHALLLLTSPLLLMAEQAMHRMSERCVERLVQSNVAPGGAIAIRRVVLRGTRLRDAALPEAAIAIVALAAGQAALWGLVSPKGLLAAPGATVARSLVQVWWAILSLPAAQFLLYRSLWRWIVWCVVLWGVAGLDIRPVALHPDRRGGLAFLAEPAQSFAIVVMSIVCLVAGTWGGQMIFAHVPLASWAEPFSEIAVASFIVTLGPLCAFSGCLWRARFTAVRQYDMFALGYARAFHEKWVDARHTDEVLGTSDIQSMADLANTLAIVRGMRVVPFGRLEITALLAALVLPILPLVLVEMPVHQLVRRLVGFVLGAAVG
jgi:hypothetical protein